MPLTLTRREGESVHAGPVVVTVVSVNAGKVKLKFEAPKEVKVLRSELTKDEADLVSHIPQH